MTTAYAETSEQHSEQPWLSRIDWAENAIKSSNKSMMICLCVLALIWNSFSWPLVVLILPDELRNGNYPALLGLLFPLGGIALAAWASVLSMRYLKFGESTFQMSAVPGVIGGTLSGVIKSSCKISSTDGFHQRLSCIERIRNPGKNPDTRRIIWQTNRVVARELTDSVSESAVPVHFAIPFDAEPTSVEGRRSVSWQLEVHSAMPGVDYKANFEVPVFVTADSSPEFEANQDLIAGYTSESSVAAICSKARINRFETDQQIDYSFPLFRHVGDSIVLAVATLFWWSIILVAVFACAEMKLGLFAIAIFGFLAIFGIIGLLMIAGVVDILLWKCHIKVKPDSLSYQAGLLGIGRKHNIRQSEIAEVVVKPTGQRGDQLVYSLNLKTRAGIKHCFGKRIAGDTAAKAISSEISDFLSLPAPTVEYRKKINGVKTSNKL